MINWLARSPRTHRAVDAAILWRLGASRYENRLEGIAEAAEPEQFWSRSSVHAPSRVSVAAEWGQHGTRHLRLEGASHGPGAHAGSRKLIADAHLTASAGTAAPLVLILHGYAVPFPFWDAAQARRLRAHGAHSLLLDLPFHMRRRAPGRRSGDGFFHTDPSHIAATVRQSVEDAAALVAWARAEVTPTVRVLGVSLGGLIATLLAAQVEVDAAVAVAPFCDPPSTFMSRLPGNARRRLGITATSGGRWGVDQAAARAMLDVTLAPIVPANLVPRTSGTRITLVRPLYDSIVGPGPIADLAAAWGTELWDYPHGHITVMNAPGINARIHQRLLRPAPQAPGDSVTRSLAG